MYAELKMALNMKCFTPNNFSTFVWKKKPVPIDE
jgi:hypothetical protein